MESKNALVRRLVKSGEYKQALQICKDWEYKESHYRDILRLGYECLLYPDFYRQIGKNPESEYEKAVLVLKSVYSETSPQ